MGACTPADGVSVTSATLRSGVLPLLQDVDHQDALWFQDPRARGGIIFGRSPARWEALAEASSVTDDSFMHCTTPRSGSGTGTDRLDSKAVRVRTIGVQSRTFFSAGALRRSACSLAYRSRTPRSHTRSRHNRQHASACFRPALVDVSNIDV